MTEIRLDDDTDEPAAEAAPPRRALRWAVAYAVVVALLAASIGYYVKLVNGDPDDIVADYLAAVHEGDVDAALALASQDATPGRGKDKFLKPEALRDDWRVDAVSVREQSDTDAVVDAAITGPDGRREGVFRLQRKPTGDWRIANPFILLFLKRPPLWIDGETARTRVTVNGVAATATAPEAGLSESDGIPLRLLPGSYAFFGAKMPLLKPVEDVRSWLPPGDLGSVVLHTARVELSEEGAGLATEAVTKVLTDCADSTDPEPKGCPFGAAGKRVDVDGTEYRILGDEVEWELGEIPRLYFADSGRGYLQPVEREPFTVELTIPADGGNRTVTCPVDLALLAFGVTDASTIAFAGADDAAAACDLR